MFLDIVLLIIGMVLLVKGADFFVSGSSCIARAMKIPPLVIGLTLVSMGTSAPEASVSINGAINGMNDMSLGNVIGSNVFNTLFIIGISSLIVPLAIGKDIKKYDMPIMVLIYGILIVFSFLITPFEIGRSEAIIMLVAFVGYTALLVVRANRERKAVLAESGKGSHINGNGQLNNANEKQDKKEKPIWLNIIFAIGGLAGIILGGDMVVDNAADIATALGMSEKLVGLTIVAVGTSLPELVTSVVASIKKENDIALGNVIGSNIFNVILILGLSATIAPISLHFSELVDMAALFVSGILITAIALFSKKAKTTRSQGAFLVLTYIGYLVYIIIRN